MADVLLNIDELSIRSGENILVQNVSLAIEKGKITGLVGESGSGKTLSALSILGLIPKNLIRSNGRAVYRPETGPETDLYKLSQKAMNNIRGCRITMIFQEPMTSLNPSIRCGTQAAETLIIHQGLSKAKAKERIISLFRDVKLPDPERIYRAWPHELSGGQQQRVMIAMSLATNPDLLIADEPSTALDVTVQKSILNLLLELKEKYKLSILFITHDLSIIKAIADNLYVMYRGEIVESGQAKELIAHPVSAYTKGLLACKPKLNYSPRRLPTVEDYMTGKQLVKETKISSSEQRKPILEVENIKVVYKGRHRSGEHVAVDEVSFVVYEGETLGLVGESGCGKTSLGKALLQLIDSREGSLKYKGENITGLKRNALRALRRKMQIVFQDPYSSLNPRMTVGTMLAEPIVVHKLRKGNKQIVERCYELLKQVGLPESSFHLYPHQFSGGQRQRIGIARALACEPEFIILDESVSALDVSIQAQILNLLNDLKELYRLTYIFISHDLTVVKYMSDRVIVMAEGKIEETGQAEQIYLNPASAYTRELISSILD